MQVFGFAHFEIGRAANRRSWINKIGGIKLLGAVFALIAAGFVVTAIGAGAFNVSVGQEPPVGMAVNLFFGYFPDQVIFCQLASEILGELVILRAGRTAKLIK